MYCAPEMLVNPYLFDMKDIKDVKEMKDIMMVAQSSRSTDMYAFGLLAWQVIAQRRPFTEMTSESMLCSYIHQGQRPPLEKLPSNTPDSVRDMIVSCWHTDRVMRKSALECCAILEREVKALSAVEPPNPRLSMERSVANSIFSSYERFAEDVFKSAEYAKIHGVVNIVKSESSKRFSLRLGRHKSNASRASNASGISDDLSIFDMSTVYQAKSGDDERNDNESSSPSRHGTTDMTPVRTSRISSVINALSFTPRTSSGVPLDSPGSLASGKSYASVVDVVGGDKSLSRRSRTYLYPAKQQVRRCI